MKQSFNKIFPIIIILFSVAMGIYGALVLDGRKTGTNTPDTGTKIATTSATLTPTTAPALRQFPVPTPVQPQVGSGVDNFTTTNNSTVVNNPPQPQPTPQPTPTPQAGIILPLPTIKLPLGL